MIIGSWKDEVDGKQWQAHGFECLILRTPTLGCLCGYVGLPSDHPWYEKDYHEIYDAAPDLNVHGGLTFADHGDEKREPRELWWIGFDCGHSGDLLPGSIEWDRDHGWADYHSVYRDMAYVTRETEFLASQAAGAVGGDKK